MRGVILAVVLFLYLLGQAFAGWRVVEFGGRRYVPLSDVATFYKLNQSATLGASFRLSSPGYTLEGQAQTQAIRIQGVKYVLCFPILSKDGEHYLSAMDVAKIIEPVLRPGKIKSTGPVTTIILDPGHGGHDSGAVGRYGREKDYALDVALRVRALLLKEGMDVKMTRSRDVLIPLEKRAAFANRFQNALFVSLHFNAGGTSTGTGVETYALAPRGVPSMDEKYLRDSDLKQHPGNVRDAENIALATAVHASMVRALSVTDRGVKRARFVVLKNLRIPGVLVEGGFITHPSDSRLVAMADYRQRLAQSVTTAIANYRRRIQGPLPEPTLVVAADAPSTVPSLHRVSQLTNTVLLEAGDGALRPSVERFSLRSKGLQMRSPN